MNSSNTNLSSRHADWRPLPVEWLETEAMPVDLAASGSRQNSIFSPAPRQRRICVSAQETRRPSHCAFTLLEMMIVIGIIGFLTAMALPHMKGFTAGSAMTAATRQLLDDINLARQRAIANRSEVCIVFLPPGFWTNTIQWQQQTYSPGYLSNASTANLYFHQCAAYATIAMRTVGDQPGKSNAFYLTDWKTLPQGVFISPFQFTNQILTNLVCTTNTTSGLTNWFPITGFPTNQLFPFPSIATNSWFVANNPQSQCSNYMPYIAFTPTGQLLSGSDQYIMLAAGAILAQANAGGPTSANWTSPDIEETPPNNDASNPNILHIDWLTGRTRLERNQF